MNGKEVSGRRRETKEKSTQETPQKATILRNQEEMATVSVRKGRLCYPASLVK
jgi:hypothetical protein